MADKLPESVRNSVKNRYVHIFVGDEDLLEKPVWSCYKNDTEIINPESGENAYSDDASTWGSFSAACDYIDKHDDYILGLQLGEESDFSAIHISNCVMPDNTITSDYNINEVIKYCESYIEYDKAGKGLTFLLSGNNILPHKPYIKKFGDIEISLYDHYHCIPITGKLYENKSVEEEMEEMGLGYHPDVTPYVKTQSPEFLKVIYEWFSGKFSGTMKEDKKDTSSILPEIKEKANLTDVEKYYLNDLLNNNKYFNDLWYRTNPSDSGARHDDIDLVARIYSVIPYNRLKINDIYKASMLFKTKNKEEKMQFEEVEKPFKDSKQAAIAALAGNKDNFYKAVSPTMKRLIEIAKDINQDKDFMRYDNDVDLITDKIYGDILKFETDKDCAEIFLNLYSSKIKYRVGTKSSWYVYNGSYWVAENDKTLPHIRSFGEDLSERLAAVLNWSDLSIKEKKSIQRGIKRFANVTSFKNILTSAKSKSTASSDLFDSEKRKLAVGNGTVELESGELKENCPKDYFTLHTDVPYYMHNTRPRKFIKFLNDIFDGNRDLISYLQTAMGYCITGDTDAQVFFVFYGEGGNGKSTLMNIMEEVLGDYVGTFDSYALEKKNDGEGRANPLLILNQSKRYVVIPEKNEYTQLDIALIKAISGGDRISTRMLHENNIKPFRPTYKMIFTTNFLPNINWDDEGIKRRYRIIPFYASFKGDNADPRKAEKILKDEKPLILKWLVDGARQYYKNPSCLDNIPKIMKQAMHEARSKQDGLYAYMKDCLDVIPNDKSKTIQAHKLYENYKQWCSENDRDIVSEKIFGTRMPDILDVKKEKGKNQCMQYLGVQFKAHDAQTDNKQ